jgi:chromosome partitioning protein
MARQRANQRGAASAARSGEMKTKWLLIASGKGGNGKTSTTLNLGVMAAHAGLRVGLVDLDSQRSLSRWHDRREAQSNVRKELPELVLWSGRLQEAEKAIADLDDIEGLDLVIVDTPPGLDDQPEAVAALLRKADFVLVPTTQGQLDVDSVIEWMNYVTRERKLAAFVINRAQRNLLSFRAARYRLIEAGELVPYEIRQLEDVQATYGLGVGVVEMTRSNAVDDYLGIWGYVSKKLGIKRP